MSQYFAVHSTHPQARLLARAAELIRGGGVAAYPTDATYVLGCGIGEREAAERVRQIRRLERNHYLTLMCRDLSEIALYARVDDPSYRILRRLTPGPFTFILPATRELPRRLVDRRRRTVGLRIPDCAIVLELLEALAQPMMSTTLRLPGDDVVLNDPEDIRERLDRAVDVIIDGGSGGMEPTTVVDLTGPVPEVIRQGIGLFE